MCKIKHIFLDCSHIYRFLRICMCACAAAFFLVAQFKAIATQVFSDPSFGSNGIITAQIGTRTQPNALSVQADGKIVTTGVAIVNNVPRIFVARYTSAGVLDVDFSTAGLVTTSIGTGAWGRSVVVQADGKIVVAGYATISGVTRAVLIRYMVDGILDATFGTSGIVTQSTGTSAAFNACALQTIGETTYIVACGSAVINNIPQFFCARYLMTDGTLDTGFGTAGIAATPIGSVSGIAALLVQSDGKAVAVGSALVSGGRVIALARYTLDGVLDADFGVAQTGIVITSVPDSVDDGAQAALLQSDGKIVVAGQSQINGRGYCMVARYLNAGVNDGTLDVGFGVDGIVTTRLSATGDAGMGGLSIAVTTAGKIILAGAVDNSAVLARLTVAGLIDTSFGAQGIVATSFGNDETVCSAALDASGKIILASTSGVLCALGRFYSDNADFVVIDSPVDGATVTERIHIVGRVSRSGAMVRIKADGTEIARAPTDVYGKWDAGVLLVLLNGACALAAELMVDENLVATNVIALTIATADAIVITSMENNCVTNTTQPSLYGRSSRASASIKIIIDGTEIERSITDAKGQWNAGIAPVMLNGLHGIVAQLLSGESVVAQTTNVLTVQAEAVCNGLVLVGGTFAAKSPPVIISGSGISCPPRCDFLVTRLAKGLYEVTLLPVVQNTPTFFAMAEKTGPQDATVTIQTGGSANTFLISTSNGQSGDVSFISVLCRT